MTDTSTLILEFSGSRDTEGLLRVALFDSASGYPDDSSRAVRTASVAIEAIPQIVTFEDLPFGSYAATVLHDANADEKMNVNALGIPKEGIGFSRNPRIWKGVPAFDRVKFEFTPENKRIEITLKYFA